MAETVTPDGERLTWAAVFWRHGAQDTETFDTADEAMDFLLSGQDYETLAPEAVLSPDGSVHYDRGAIDAEASRRLRAWLRNERATSH